MLFQQRGAGIFPDRESWSPKSRPSLYFPVRDISACQAGVLHLYFPNGKLVLTPREIGRIVRETRRSQGLRQDQLAGAAGVGVRFLVELEAGKATARIGKVLAVLAALGCNLRIEAPRTQSPPRAASDEPRR